ncbi:cupin domain-containing protein [Candidatus Pacearchaeota archaeon]|nr:cupin domain-containing protein [Candidatus Pacearchaeota archaeon]
MKKINDLIEYPNEGIISKEIIKNQSVNITLFCMAKNTDISPHTSTKKATVYVVEGKGIFNLNEDKIVMEPGVMIYMDENKIHSLKAIENTSFILTLFN